MIITRALPRAADADICRYAMLRRLLRRRLC